MKKDLIALIDSADEIEKLFHPVGGNGMPIVDTIYDVQEFQDWLQEIHLELRDIYDRTSDHFIWETLNVFNRGMNGWNDKQVFGEIKGKLKAIRKNIGRYYPDDSTDTILVDKEQQMENKKSRIFISHSSKDVDYVAKIVNLLDGMGLDQTQVFCSSLPGYGIPIDTNIFDYLRSQFLEYNLHVIFIHSDNYYQSPVSLNEMGAAWALKSGVTSILLPGFGFEKMTGVVNNQAIAIKLDGTELELKDKLNQLYTKIVEEFNLTKKADIIWEQKRNAFINEIQQVKSASTSEISISEEAVKLLLSAANDNTGQIIKQDDFSGTTIQGGSVVMNENESQRESAKWIAALDELLRIGYTLQADRKGQVYRVTDAGYKFIEKNS